MKIQTQQPNTSNYKNIKPVMTLAFILLKVGVAFGIWLLAEVAFFTSEYAKNITQLGSIIIGLFILFLLSVFLAAQLTYAVQRGLIIASPHSPLDRLVRFWKTLVPADDVRPILDEPLEQITEADFQDDWLQDFTPAEVDEMLEFIVKHKGRGRKSNIPDEQRFRVVRDWTMMQMRGTSVRLQDFLDERFGYQHDGSPHVPRDTYYGWHRKFKSMLQEYKAMKKK
jgi:hypothetical protein